MRRQRVPRRHPRLAPDDITKAAGLYQSGDSFATIGRMLRVDPGTVRRALTNLGVPVRDCHGCDRTSPLIEMACGLKLRAVTLLFDV